MVGTSLVNDREAFGCRCRVKFDQTIFSYFNFFIVFFNGRTGLPNKRRDVFRFLIDKEEENQKDGIEDPHSLIGRAPAVLCGLAPPQPWESRSSVDCFISYATQVSK